MQGVGFRFFVEREARRLKVTGYVRNVGSRQVEVVAEGERAQLEQLAEALGDGPSGAHVQNVELSWGETETASPGFTVKSSQ